MPGAFVAGAFVMPSIFAIRVLLVPKSLACQLCFYCKPRLEGEAIFPLTERHIPTKDMQTTPLPPPSQPPQKWSNFHERCAQCSIEWKINFPIFIFWVIVDFFHNFQVFLWIFFTINLRTLSTKTTRGISEYKNQKIYFSVVSGLCQPHRPPGVRTLVWGS